MLRRGFATANLLGGTFKTSGGNTVHVTTTIDAIFTRGGTDKSRHQLELSDSPAGLTSAHVADRGGSESTMMFTMMSPKWAAHEFGHWFGLDNAPEIDPHSSEDSPYMNNLMADDDEAATEMRYEDWLEILRAYREGELNNGVERR